MSKKKTLCILGTRPEVIKLAPVILELKSKPEQFDTVVLATAQHRDMMDSMLDVFSIRSDIDLNIMRPNQTLTDITARMLPSITEIINERSPDVVIVQGDTTTVFAAALACFYTHTPFAHVEAGLRTDSIWEPYPEELNRRVTSLIATFNFAPTKSSADNLIHEGTPSDSITVTGNTVIDALQHVLHSTNAPLLPIPEGKPYVLMTCHRRESFGSAIEEIFSAVRAFAQENQDYYILYPVHPNINVRAPAEKILAGLPNVVLSPPLDYVAFVHAMNRAWVILTDSGGIQEEAPSLKKPVLIMRNVTERMEGINAGCSRLVGTTYNRILNELTSLKNSEDKYNAMISGHNPYGDGTAAKKIVSTLASKL